ncbi:MAG: ATP-dependent DNA helicase RecG [Ignavibacteria bacterium]|jgi:ATP-dependent DNA helicase RecG
MDIKYLKGVGEKRAEAFKKIGINDLEDFLKFIPRIYLKRINIRDLRKYLGENAVIYGKVVDVEHPLKRNQPLKIFLSDNTGTTEIPFFGKSEFRSKQFRLNENYIFWGKVNEGFGFTKYKLDYRDHLKIDTSDKSDSDFLKFPFFPVYELSDILKKTWIKPLLLSKIVFNAFSSLLKQNKDLTEETLPEYIIKGAGLPVKKDSILRINFPLQYSDVEEARKRLAFEELFYLQLIFALKKRSIKNEVKGISFSNSTEKLRQDFEKTFKFELTSAQNKVINEILNDMKSESVMNRLLQGDVGSGKTIVSIFAMLVAVQNGYQSAIMCPTEVLAEQHFTTISNFLKEYNNISGENFTVVLLVGGQKKKLREELLEDIRTGKTNLIVGTHALIQEKVEYKNLGFVVIDEQHKFGVMQRAKLKEKGLNPDVLVMTATPIPRTLSLTYYGDLDVSVINELPGNRKPIKTFLREDEDKQNIYKFVKDEINKGRQAYIIYPLIEESEKMDLKSAEENYEILKNTVFKSYNVGMIHGRILSYEKDEVMQEFKEGKINILVSTTVIEVGIDISNATIMIIEEAQRFGLSQLHQLRGRVGRGAEQSFCILIARNLDEVSTKRLNILCETTDGFVIAETDMEIRGPGEFFGIKQSGILSFSCTDLNKDKQLLYKARDIAFNIIESDPQLRKPENNIIKSHFLKDYKDALYLMHIA